MKKNKKKRKEEKYKSIIKTFFSLQEFHNFFNIFISIIVCEYGYSIHSCCTFWSYTYDYAFVDSARAAAACQTGVTNLIKRKWIMRRLIDIQNYFRSIKKKAETNKIWSR